MIPIARPYITKEDIEETNKVLRSGNLSLGPKVPEFEEKFSKYVGTKYAVAVSSGTTALHLCMRSLRLKPKDEVITTPFSFVASANCILYGRGKPKFVDIDPKTKNIDPKLIEEAITEKTKAILPVHIFGESCDMSKIMKIAKKHNLPVIEDACEALGTTYQDQKVGTFGLASVFAFYPNKQITTGEGGMICTNNKKLYEDFKSLRNQGRSSNLQWLDHNQIGYNYRLTDISCSLGITQLKKIDFILKEREKIAQYYNKILKNIKGIQLPHLTKEKSWFVYTINLDKKHNRDDIIKKLNKRGISTKPYLPSIHLQTAYKKLYGYKKGMYPISEKTSNSSLALPFFIGLKKREMEYIRDNIKNVLK